MAEDAGETWFWDIVRCAGGARYVGISDDVPERVEEHNRGLRPSFTKSRRPVVLVWSQEFPDIFAARRREIELKGWSRPKKLRLVSESSGVRRVGSRGRVNPSNPPLAGSQGKGE